MRRAAVLLGLGIVLGVVPAQGAAPPRLAGSTTIANPRSASAVLVSLPRAISVDVANPGSWIKVSTPGRFAAIVIDDVGRKGQRGRTGLVFARLIAPLGCGYNGLCSSVEAVGVRLPGSSDYVRPTEPKLHLAAGTYRIYTVGDWADSTRTQTFKLRLPGLTGMAAILTSHPTEGGLASWVHHGPNFDSYEEHPETAGWNLPSLVAPTFHSGYTDGNPAVNGSGVSWSVRASTLLIGGVWRNPSSAVLPSDASTPVTMCWHVARQPAGLPDYWWQQPAAHADHFTGPHTPRCLDSSNAGVEKAFALTREMSRADFNFRRSPIAEPGRSFGMYVIGVQLLDAQ